VYLEPDIVGGNFDTRIMKFIVTRPLRGGQGPPRAGEPTIMIKPLQFIHHTEIRFFSPTTENECYFTPSISILCDTLQKTALYKDLHCIFGSTF
jgi:hypothetical protein